MIKIGVLLWDRSEPMPEHGPPCAMCADELIPGANVGVVGQQMVCLKCMESGAAGETAKIFYEGWDDLQLSGVGIIARRTTNAR